MKTICAESPRSVARLLKDVNDIQKYCITDVIDQYYAAQPAEHG